MAAAELTGNHFVITTSACLLQAAPVPVVEAVAVVLTLTCCDPVISEMTDQSLVTGDNIQPIRDPGPALGSAH